MANPFTVTPPNILEALMSFDKGYEGSRGIRKERDMSAARKTAAQAFKSGGDPRNFLAELIAAGDPQSANALANYGNQTFDQNYKTQTLELQRRTADRLERPQPTEIERRASAGGLKTGTPEYNEFILRGGRNVDVAPSITEKKIIIDAENDIPRLQATIKNIQRAKELNPQVFSGFGAAARGAVGSKLKDWMVPDFIADPKGSEATAEWDQVMGQEAIKMMAETLKGASTDFEMRKFLNIAADTSQPVKVRENAMNRFLGLANQELALRQKRATEIRGGSYFKPPGGNDPLAAARDAIQRGADPNAVRRRLQENGIDASGL